MTARSWGKSHIRSRRTARRTRSGAVRDRGSRPRRRGRSRPRFGLQWGTRSPRTKSPPRAESGPCSSRSRPGPIPVLLTIRQTFGRISCVMRTAEMTSRGYFADFWIDNDEQIRKLAYCYTSVPSVLIPDRSQSHDGAMLFEIIGEPAQELRENYWTTRKTTGEVTLSFRCRERLDDLPNDFGSRPMEGK